MAYNKGKYPFEAASKIAHMEVIRDPALAEILQSLRSDTPATVPPGFSKTGTVDLSKLHEISTVVTVDGGMTTIPNPTRREKRVAFIQVGIMLLSLEDLDRIAQDVFMDPRRLNAYLKRIDRYPSIVPLSGVRRPGRTLRDSNREILNAILSPPWTGLYDVLEFLLWRGWLVPTAPMPDRSMDCVQCRQEFSLPKKRTFSCPSCGFDHYLSDYLGLTTETEDNGREQLASMVMATIELLALFLLPMKLCKARKLERLQEILLIKDGPLMLRAEGYRIVDGVREFVEWLYARGHCLNLVGVEKTGDFAEFIQDFEKQLPEPGDYFLPSRKFVIEQVQGRSFDPDKYRNRVSFGSRLGVRLSPTHIVALQLPTSTLDDGGPLESKPADMPAMENCIRTLSRLTSTKPDNAILPLVLANSAVSLSDRPSAGILDDYLTQMMGATA